MILRRLVPGRTVPASDVGGVCSVAGMVICRRVSAPREISLSALCALQIPHGI